MNNNIEVYPWQEATSQYYNSVRVRFAEDNNLNDRHNINFIDVCSDKRMETINPFDPNIHPILQEYVVTEAKRNPFYFFRECVRVRRDDMDTPDKFGPPILSSNIIKALYTALILGHSVQSKLIDREMECMIHDMILLYQTVVKDKYVYVSPDNVTSIQKRFNMMINTKQISIDNIVISPVFNIPSVDRVRPLASSVSGTFITDKLISPLDMKFGTSYGYDTNEPMVIDSKTDIENIYAQHKSYYTHSAFITWTDQIFIDHVGYHPVYTLFQVSELRFKSLTIIVTIDTTGDLNMDALMNMDLTPEQLKMITTTPRYLHDTTREYKY